MTQIPVDEKTVQAIVEGVEELKKVSPLSYKVVAAGISLLALFGIGGSALSEIGGRIFVPQEVVIPDFEAELEPLMSAIQEHSNLPAHIATQGQLVNLETNQHIMNDNIETLEMNQAAQTESMQDLAQSVNTLNGQFETFFQIMLSTRRLEE